MPAQKRRAVGAKNQESCRASVSFPPELYEILGAIAQQKKVSLAWVVREASERYVSDQWPLLGWKPK